MSEPDCGWQQSKRTDVVFRQQRTRCTTAFMTWTRGALQGDSLTTRGSCCGGGVDGAGPARGPLGAAFPLFQAGVVATQVCTQVKFHRRCGHSASLAVTPLQFLLLFLVVKYT